MHGSLHLGGVGWGGRLVDGADVQKNCFHSPQSSSLINKKKIYVRLFLINVMKDLNPSINSLLCRVEVGVGEPCRANTGKIKALMKVSTSKQLQK